MARRRPGVTMTSVGTAVGGGGSGVGGTSGVSGAATWHAAPSEARPATASKRSTSRRLMMAIVDFDWPNDPAYFIPQDLGRPRRSRRARRTYPAVHRPAPGA